eukprot:1195441-Prorocentrum_minimum.AAC.13
MDAGLDSLAVVERSAHVRSFLRSFVICRRSTALMDDPWRGVMDMCRSHAGDSGCAFTSDLNF